jgi:hypothetical protein
MRLHARTDDNQREIVDALRSVGASVQLLHTVGKGCPDLLVGFRGQNFLLEVKDGKKPLSAQALTEDEKRWHLMWGGSVHTVRDVDEALVAIGVRPNTPKRMEPGQTYGLTA